MKKEIIKNIFGLRGEKTVILVSHNKDILLQADKIYEVKNGNLYKKII